MTIGEAPVRWAGSSRRCHGPTQHSGSRDPGGQRVHEASHSFGADLQRVDRAVGDGVVATAPLVVRAFCERFELAWLEKAVVREAVEVFYQICDIPVPRSSCIGRRLGGFLGAAMPISLAKLGREADGQRANLLFQIKSWQK